jgi:hypothetical protein
VNAALIHVERPWGLCVKESDLQPSLWVKDCGEPKPIRYFDLANFKRNFYNRKLATGSRTKYGKHLALNAEILRKEIRLAQH